MGAATATPTGQGVMNRPVCTALCPRRWISNGSATSAVICAMNEHTEVATESENSRLRSRSNGIRGVARGSSWRSSTQPSAPAAAICSSPKPVAASCARD